MNKKVTEIAHIILNFWNFYIILFYRKSGHEKSLNRRWLGLCSGFQINIGRKNGLFLFIGRSENIRNLYDMMLTVQNHFVGGRRKNDAKRM